MKSSKELSEQTKDQDRKADLANKIFACASITFAALIFYVSSIPGSDLPSNLGIMTTIAHFCEYALLSGMIVLAISRPKRSKTFLIVVALVISSAYGITDEIHQYFVPGRYTDIIDWIVDLAGSTVGATIAYYVDRFARKLFKANTPK